MMGDLARRAAVLAARTVAVVTYRTPAPQPSAARFTYFPILAPTHGAHQRVGQCAGRPEPQQVAVTSGSGRPPKSTTREP